jgi:aspergillopepsin I
LQKLQARYSVTEQSIARRADYGNAQGSSKQKGSAKVKASSSGLSFFVPTVIGNQTFNLIYDTGSSDL